MKMRFLLGSVLLATAGLLVPDAAADPLLPYSQPIAVQLTNDINASHPETPTLLGALNAYHKTSKTLYSDTTILRNLNSLLDDVAGYAPLIAEAALDYQEDFEIRRDEITAQLIPAPISANKTLARKSLTRVSNTLSNAAIATTPARRIGKLRTASKQLISASNSVQRALRTKPGLSKMVATIGGLAFNSEKGQVIGGGDFVNNLGGTIGEFSSNGVLSVSAVDSGPIVRGLHLHLTGVDGTFPATYPLGVGDNRAFYDATDLRRNDEYHFRADAGMTNEVVTNSFVTIDYIGTNSCFCGGTNVVPNSGYILGRFQFVGTNISVLNVNTNRTTVTVSKGEFQLNFDIQVPSSTNEVTAPE
jgi:hypothetical protein